jgi:hypothetical protein
MSLRNKTAVRQIHSHDVVQVAGTSTCTTTIVAKTEIDLMPGNIGAYISFQNTTVGYYAG